MKRKPTLTIGIPAFNEEKNIYKLLKFLLKQNRFSFKLAKIMVASDGSTDKTNDIVRGCKNNFMVLVDNVIRQGKSARINQIIRLTSSDILVLLDADVLPENTCFLENLVGPIINKSADLTSARLKAVSASNYFETIMEYGSSIKNEFFENINEGNNVYTCHGTARAFSKKLYKKINFKDSVGEDAYSYFYCLQHGYSYVFSKTAAVLYKLPSNFRDFLEQNKRFLASKIMMINIFDKEMVHNSYAYSKRDFLINIFGGLGANPILGLSYFILLIAAYIVGFFIGLNINTWNISKSTKTVKNSYTHNA